MLQTNQPKGIKKRQFLDWNHKYPCSKPKLKHGCSSCYWVSFFNVLMDLSPLSIPKNFVSVISSEYKFFPVCCCGVIFIPGLSSYYLTLYVLGVGRCSFFFCRIGACLLNRYIRLYVKYLIFLLLQLDFNHSRA